MSKELVIDLTIGDEGVTVWIDKKHIITIPNEPITIQNMKVVFNAPTEEGIQET